MSDDERVDDTFEGADDELEDTANLDEVMHRKDAQYWAFGLGILAVPLVLWGVHRPLSCIEFSPEDATVPGKCEGLFGKELASQLPNFCWSPCSNLERRYHLFLSLATALFLQAIVVFLTHNECGNWLRMSWYFDPTDILETPRHIRSTQVSFFRRPLFSVKKKFRGKAQQAALRSLTKHAVQQLVSAESASFAARAWMLICMVRLAVLIISSISWMPATFECSDLHGPLRVSAKPMNPNPKLCFVLFLALSILAFAFTLQSTAQWIVKVIIKERNSDDVFNQFVRTKDSAFVVRSADKLDSAFDVLQKVSLMELAGLQYVGIWYSAEQALGRVPLPGNSSEVTLAFKRRSKPLMDNAHRKWAIYNIAVAGVLLWVACTSCWSCVSSISVFEGSTALQLDRWLLLMGACGRHNLMGLGCRIGSYMLCASLIQQLFIVFCSERRVQGYQSVTPVGRYQQLLFPLVDLRKNHSLDPNWYKDVDAPLPELKCHVWVAQKPGRKAEEPMDCSVNPMLDAPFLRQDERRSTSGSGETIDRQHWVRSSQPRKVQLLPCQRRESQLAWMAGLVRDDYNVPSVCIEFTAEINRQERVITQIVPPEFIAGHFHAWIHLGPVVAWEQMSAGLCFAAFILASIDVTQFLAVENCDLLTSFDDVLNNAKCVRIENHVLKGNPVSFSPSFGVFFALAGGTVALKVCLGLRVAKLTDAEKEENKEAVSVLRGYINALLYNCKVTCSLLSGVCACMWSSLRSEYVRHRGFSETDFEMRGALLRPTHASASD